MGRFNLLDEKWLKVMVDGAGAVKEVSLIELFREAHHYKGLAGETVTQDFAVLRLLLAVLHTVYSRFDTSGEVYELLHLDEMYRPIGDVDQEDYQELNQAYMETWGNLWLEKEFGSIIEEYLTIWRESFYLLDDAKPFAQITKEELEKREINQKKPGSVSGKNINRLISESNNKKALFSPKYDSENNKELLSESEIARWLLTFHGYVGLSDKAIFGTDKYNASKGWLFDIGGIYLEGNTLAETLLLNLPLVHPEASRRNKPQKPAWEQTLDTVLDKLMSEQPIDNLAELYTNWSRAIYIDPETDVTQPFSFDIIKVPEINHQDQFLEVMTVWKDNKTGDWKGTLTPRKHTPEQAIWRSFGLLTLPNTEEHRKPGIVDWLNNLLDLDVEVESNFKFVSMKADNIPPSRVPIDEIYDVLSIEEHVVTDVQENGWVPRINDEVEKTKRIVSQFFRGFVNDLNEIRNSKNSDLVDRVVSEAYFAIDLPFRNWLSLLSVKDSKNEKVMEWQQILRKMIVFEADKLVQNAGNREFIGIQKEGKQINIATAYNKFMYHLNKELPKGETNDRN